MVMVCVCVCLLLCFSGAVFLEHSMYHTFKGALNHFWRANYRIGMCRSINSLSASKMIKMSDF